MKVYLAERYQGYYEGGSQLVGIFSTYEKAWERIDEVIADSVAAANSEYGDRPYSVSEFGVISIELDQKMNLL